MDVGEGAGGHRGEEGLHVDYEEGGCHGGAIEERGSGFKKLDRGRWRARRRE